jgi:TetR/AcrR family transcriptional regulator, mexJK operon transcriptional repressor
MHAALDALGERMALAVVRPEVVVLRRLLIGEARTFPELASDYFNRPPGSVIAALALGFDHLEQRRSWRVENSHIAAAPFAYLVVGEPLDRAMLTGHTPDREHVVAVALDGVETFMARYGAST